MPYDKITYGKMLYGKSILREDIKTMVFSSAIFLLMFLPIVFILNYFCKKEYSNILLLILNNFHLLCYFMRRYGNERIMKDYQSADQKKKNR